MKKGFSLLEVLVTSLILGFVLTGVTMFLIVTTEISQDAALDIAAQNNFNLIYNEIVREVRSAKSARASSVNKDTLYVTKQDSSLITFYYNRSTKRISKQTAGELSKDLAVIVSGSQQCEFDCSFTNDASFLHKVIFIDKLTCRVENGKTVSIAGISGAGNETSIACRNE